MTLDSPSANFHLIMQIPYSKPIVLIFPSRFFLKKKNSTLHLNHLCNPGLINDHLIIDSYAVKATFKLTINFNTERHKIRQILPETEHAKINMENELG